MEIKLITFSMHVRQQQLILLAISCLFIIKSIHLMFICPDACQTPAAFQSLDAAGEYSPMLIRYDASLHAAGDV
jgi:hypothetical protein